MKSFRPYLIFSVCATIGSIILSKLLNFSLTNTWQAGLALLLVFGPGLFYFWKVSSQMKHQRPFFAIAIKICEVVFLLGSCIAAIVAVTQGANT